MAPDPIVFALAVPEPEIEPAAARAAGAQVVATGRSDYPEHDGHLARLPGRLPRAARLPRPQHPPAHAALRRPGAGRHGPAGRAARRPHRARASSISGSRPAIAAAVVRAAIEAGEAGRDHRAGSGRRAHPPLRLRGPPAPAANRPPAASTRRSARRRSSCAGATAACSKSTARSRSAITTS